ncbi:MAG: KilA-N domain-containing protein [Treponema sp.]|jgi:hypothetical protein|nr:KilA-N domain-containing protein [Treponema sp.]
MAKMTVLETEITVIKINDEDYISLTDMVRNFENGEFFILNWLRNRNTIEFLGIWERVYNPGFNPVEFDRIKSQSGLNSHRISAKEWCEKTNAIGIQSRAGRYGGTFAHKDIAFEFGMWISAEFKIYLIKEFQRLKEAEQKLIGWTAKRELAKINYHIHTDAVKQHLVPKELTPKQSSIIYADEADVLNIALFGKTAKEWRDKNPDLKGNIRDHATINELICLSNMENINAVLINDNIPQNQRLLRLNKIAIQQMTILVEVQGRKLLK